MGVPPARILVADDNPSIQKLVRLYLEDEGYAVIIAGDGPTALEEFTSREPDLVILDIMLPGCDGWEVSRRMRSVDPVPIIMLSALSEDHDKILGLELGADDYVTKPFNPRELMARVRAVLRRAGARGPEGAETLEFPGLYIDRSSYRVTTDAGPVQLTARELEILWALANEPERVFTRENILNLVWGYDTLVDERTVDTHIKRIRSKLPDESEVPWQIETIWGVGYRFRCRDPRDS